MSAGARAGGSWLTAAAPLLLWLLALLWAVLPEFDAPWSAERQRGLAPIDWQPLAAQVEQQADGVWLRATSLDQPFGARRDGLDLAADDFDYLNVQWSALPTGAQLFLLWQADGHLQRALLPYGAGGSSVALAELPGWKGRIGMLGLLITAQDVAAAAALPSREAYLRAFTLSDRNRRSALAAVVSSWLAHRPWTGVSINSAGLELGHRPPLPWQPWLAALGAALGWWLGWRQPPRRRGWLAFAAAWLLLLALQCWQQLLRARDYTVLAQQSQQRELPLSASAPLAIGAERVLQALQGVPPPPRLLVYGGNPFFRQYTPFLLHAHDVAPLPSLAALPADAGRRGAVLVLVGSGDWQFEAAARQLRVAGRTLAAEALVTDGVVQAYRLLESQP